MKLLLARVGGLSPVRQHPDAGAPAQRGVWCWIWPYVDPHLLSGMSAQGGLLDAHAGTTAACTGKVVTRLDQLRTEGLRVFTHTGPVWTHFELPQALATLRGWTLVGASVLVAYLHRFGKTARTRWTRDVPARYAPEHPKNGGSPLGPVHTGRVRAFSFSESFEVFVERPTGGKDPRRDLTTAFYGIE